MMTTTMSPASIGHSNKFKFAVVPIILFILVSMGVIIYSIYFFSKDDGYDPKVYDNPEDAINLFIDNQTEFDEIVPILKGNELFDYLYSIDRKSIFGPSIPKREKYLSEAEYGCICDFLNEFRPYEIGLTNGQLCFVFSCRSGGVTVYHTELKGEKLSRFLYYVGQDGILKKINDNWYIRVYSIDLTRQ